MKVLFIDFDKYYLDKEIPSNYLVLSSDYQKLGAISILNYTKCRSSVLNEFNRIFDENEKLDKIFTINKMILFLNFFYPLGQWISAIDEFICQLKKNDEKITIIFSSFSNNPNISLFEAEGEINSSFLYHKSFFLSYYIKLYLSSLALNKIIVLNNRTFNSKFFYYLRGIIVVNFKLIQLLFYKTFVLKRNYINKKVSSSNQTILSSRGIVHTQFMKGILEKLPDYTIAIINEGSARPFMNFRTIKKNQFDFFYAEGYLSLKQIANLYISSLKLYFIKKSKPIKFMDMTIDMNKLLPELGLFDFNMNSYATSIYNAKNKLQKSFNFKKFISFEILYPFAHYVKDKIQLETVQIQTIAIYKEDYPNFLFADKLYFSNNKDFIYHSEKKPSLSQRYFKLENLKYLGLKKLKPKSIIKKITYFTQPIYKDEEIELLKYLKEFSSLNNYDLFIKLHPRSESSSFKFLKLPIINKSISSHEAIRNSDLVITRDSAIGYDAWFLNVPILFFLHGMLNGENLSFIPDNYNGKFYTMPTFIYLRDNINNIIKQFYSHKYHANFIINEDYLIKEILSVK
jgi:hypothetical protein